MRWIAAVAAFVFAGCASGPVGNVSVPSPAKAVDLARYVGTWYEIARYENGFEKGCDGVTAAYAALPNGHVGIINTCRKGSAGKPDVARGEAKILDGSDGAKLKVSFFGPFYVGDYWVLDHAEDYRWSIVGEPSGRYLWILSRQQNLADAERAGLVARAVKLGYDPALIRLTTQP